MVIQKPFVNEENGNGRLFASLYSEYGWWVNTKSWSLRIVTIIANFHDFVLFIVIVEFYWCVNHARSEMLIELDLNNHCLFVCTTGYWILRNIKARQQS